MISVELAGVGVFRWPYPDVPERISVQLARELRRARRPPRNRVDVPVYSLVHHGMWWER